MIRRAATAAVVTGLSVVALRTVVARGRDRILEAPRTGPGEERLGPALDALGGEVVRFRSRDGLRLAGRWLPAEPDGTSRTSPDADDWAPEPHEAILLLHGWTGSSAPDAIELGPFLRRIAGVLALDFGGHGGSDDAPTTFGLREIEDVAGALAWLGERGIERVAIVGRSMGGIAAIAAVTVLGDGSLAGVDRDPDPAAGVAPPRRPRIVAVVGDSVAPELWVPIAARMRGPVRHRIADAMLGAAARSLGDDPRETEPIRVIGLLDGTPLLLIAGEADATVPIAEARRLIAAAPEGTASWTVPGADHGRAHETDPNGYETRVGEHLRAGFTGARGSRPIIATPEPNARAGDGPVSPLED